MAKITPAQQTILDDLQNLANELGHIPSRAEFDASELSARLPMFRINGLLHSFEKAVARLNDPALAALSAEDAQAAVIEWALSSQELPTPTAWKRSISCGADLLAWDVIVAASGLTVNQLQDKAHAALTAKGLSPTGKARTRYAHKVDSAEVRRARTAAPQAPIKRTRTAEDAEVARLLRAESEARAAAGVRQGRLQTSDDRTGSELWIGQAS